MKVIGTLAIAFIGLLIGYSAAPVAEACEKVNHLDPLSPCKVDISDSIESVQYVIEEAYPVCNIHMEVTVKEGVDLKVGDELTFYPETIDGQGISWASYMSSRGEHEMWITSKKENIYTLNLKQEINRGKVWTVPGNGTSYAIDNVPYSKMLTTLDDKVPAILIIGFRPKLYDWSYDRIPYPQQFLGFETETYQCGKRLALAANRAEERLEAEQIRQKAFATIRQIEAERPKVEAFHKEMSQMWTDVLDARRNSILALLDQNERILELLVERRRIVDSWYEKVGPEFAKYYERILSLHDQIEVMTAAIKTKEANLNQSLAAIQELKDKAEAQELELLTQLKETQDAVQATLTE